MGDRKHVYRLVVDSWPTPDGQPFRDQPIEFWRGVVDAYLSVPGGKPPTWLPDDFESWLPQDASPFGGVHPAARPGFTFSDSEGPEPQTGYAGYFSPLLTVPCAPTRRFFTSRVPLECLATLREWGCVAHVERAQRSGYWRCQHRDGHTCNDFGVDVDDDGLTEGQRAVAALREQHTRWMGA